MEKYIGKIAYCFRDSASGSPYLGNIVYKYTYTKLLKLFLKILI